MANNENLKPIRTENEAREKGRNGGIKSGIKRRERKTMKEILIYLLSQKAYDVFGEETGRTNIEQIMFQQIQNAIRGNLKAVEFIRDTIGEKLTDKEEPNQIDL